MISMQIVVFNIQIYVCVCSLIIQFSVLTANWGSLIYNEQLFHTHKISFPSITLTILYFNMFPVFAASLQ